MTYDTAPIAADSLDPTAVYIVDDDEGVRQSLAALLLAREYTVRAFDGGEAFLAQAALDHPGCVLLDLTMPRMDGQQTFEELRKIHPTLPVLLMSGFSELEATFRFAGQGLAGFIQKPFETVALVEQLRLVIQGTAK